MVTSAPPPAVAGAAALRAALAALPVCRLHARHELLDDLQTEPFMGNLWRGQLGAWWHAHAPSAFAALMGEDTGGRPWALCAPWSDAAWVPAGAILESRVTLIGPGVAHAAAVIDALGELGRAGLGARRGASGQRTGARLSDLRLEPLPGTSQTQPSLLDVLDHPAAPTGLQPGVADCACQPLWVALKRPLRVKESGKVFLGVPTLEQLLRRTLGRLVQLLPAPPDGHDRAEERSRLFEPEAHAALVAAARACHCVGHDLQAWHWRRQSRRTHQAMPLEGLTGRLHYAGPHAALRPWLRIADWLQIGSKTTFGFGVLELR
jgi:hypothetical protein